MIVCTAHSDAFAPLAALTVPNHVAYCRRHGYEYRCDILNGPRPAWYKAEVLRRYLPQDDVFYLDVDAFFTSDAPLPDEHNSITLTTDINGLNDGVMLWRRDDASLAFLEQWYARGFYLDAHLNSDQVSLALLLWNIHRHVTVLPQRSMNSYDYRLYNGLHGDYPQGQWEPGDLILHLAALTLPQRIQRFHEYERLHTSPSPPSCQ